MKKIFIISDNVIFRHGIKRILSDQRELSVSGEASCMKDLWPDFEKELPHMIILDMMLPKNQILPISKKLHTRFPNIPCLLISADNIEYIFLECLIRGTFGFLWKESSPDELITAIQTIFQGENYFRIPESKQNTKVVRQILTRNAAGKKPSAITHREMEVLRGFAEGYSYLQIAGMLKISRRTVESHRKNILGKLGLKSNADLVRYALKNQIIR